MDLGSNGVPSPMNEVVAEASRLDVISRCPVHFPSTHRAATGDAFLHHFYSGVACVANHSENFLHSSRWRVAHEAGPGDVVIDGARRILLGPNVEQNEITFANGRRVFSVWFVVRIAAMGVDSDDGRIVRHQILALESLHEPLLNLMLVRPPVTHSQPDFLESRGGNGVHRIPRREMCPDLLVRPG